MASFDELYLAGWAKLKDTPGLFRNPCYEETQRRPLGSSAETTGAITQFNPEHLKNKRPSGMSPKADLRVVKDFDHSLFNFTKAKESEIVLKVKLDPNNPDDLPSVVWSAAAEGEHGSHSSEAQDQQEHIHPFFANISPIMGGHGLFVPQLTSCLPQVMTTAHLTLALRVMALAQRRDFHLGFNSLAAWASVNHLHFHATFIADAFPTDGRFPVENAAVTRLAAVELPPVVEGGGGGIVTLEVSELSGWPLGGYKFALRPDGAAGSDSVSSDSATLQAPHPRHVAALGAAGGALTSHMTACDVAHNLLLADGGATLYVLPRQHQKGLGADEGRMAVAFAESCGIGIVYSQHVFDSFSEDEYAQALREYRIEEGPQAEGLRKAAVDSVLAQAAPASAGSNR